MQVHMHFFIRYNIGKNQEWSVGKDNFNWTSTITSLHNLQNDYSVRPFPYAVTFLLGNIAQKAEVPRMMSSNY